MAGPTVSVILKERMTQFQREAVWNFIARFAEHVLPSDNSFSSNGRPFVLGWGTDQIELYTERDYQAAIGWPPRDSLELGAMGNGTQDHSELARLAMALAAEYDGLICFGDSLGEAAQSVPGQLWKVYDRGEDLSLPCWAQVMRHCHVGDAEFLLNWLKHPGFHMIK